MELVLDIVFILVGVVLPVLLYLNARQGRRQADIRWSAALRRRMYYANGTLLLFMAALVLNVWYFSGRSFTDLGLSWGSPPYDPVAVGILFAFLLLYAGDIYSEVGNQHRQKETRRRFRQLGFLPTDGVQYLHFLFLCVCAGVGEEIVYRGFLISYLSEHLDGGGLAAAATLVLPALSFGLAHLYQGGQAVIKIIAMALLFGFFFYRTQSLYPLMLLHTAIDAVGGLLNWYLEREA